MTSIGALAKDIALHFSFVYPLDAIIFTFLKPKLSSCALKYHKDAAETPGPTKCFNSLSDLYYLIEPGACFSKTSYDFEVSRFSINLPFGVSSLIITFPALDNLSKWLQT